MNVDSSNEMEYVDLYNFLQNRYEGKVHLYPGFVHEDSSGCQSSSCYDSNLDKALFFKKIFDKSSIYSKEIYPRITNKSCISNTRNGYLIGPEGEMYKCWHHLGLENKIIGNVLDDQNISNWDLFANSMLKEDCLFDKECTDCTLFPVCTGGCPELRHKGTKGCIPAKAMLDDFLMMHYITKKNKIK